MEYEGMEEKGIRDIKGVLDEQIGIYDGHRIGMLEERTDFESSNHASMKERMKTLRMRLKPVMPIAIIWTLWLVMCMHMIWHTFTLALSLIYLDIEFIDTNIWNGLFWLVLAVGCWCYSTKYDYWNYARRKISTLYIAIICLCLYVAQMFIMFSLAVVVRMVFLIPVNKDITVNMVISLARVVGCITGVLPPVLILHKLLGFLNDSDNKKMIIRFKVDRNIDLRRGKRYKYDWKIVRNKETGDFINVREEDRWLHAMADGTTGTAKTSAVFTTGIVNDLDRKIANEDVLKKKFEKMVKQNKLVLLDDIKDYEFSIAHFAPTMKGEKKFAKLTSMIRPAGMTTLAPNESFADTIYDFAVKRGIKVNRVDPILVDGKHKPGFIGFNPLFINPKFEGIRRKIEIFSKASMFADVCQTIYELNGKGDPYFTSLNRNISTTIVVLLELTTWEVNKRQATPGDVQNVINDFSRAQKYLDVLKRRSDSGEYTYIIDIVENQLLGEGAKKLNEQANGLKVLINELLMHPLVKEVLCAEVSVDIDEALENGEITVVNYALELGQSQATAFGLFFALNFNNAVMRRPGNENTRIPHFYYIDEFPFLLHPRMEQCFTMFRQFRVCSCVALQTLDQLEKNELTKYMRNVLLGNTAHQIFFGRMSPTEMKLLEDMGGKYMMLLEQNTVSEQALSVENTSKTMSSRVTKTKDTFLEGADARYKDFMEVTFFTVSKGCAMLPVAGKVNFIEKYRKSKVARYRVDWHSLYDADKAAEYKPIIREPEDFKEPEAVLPPVTTEGTIEYKGDRKKDLTEGMVILKNNKPLSKENNNNTETEPITQQWESDDYEILPEDELSIDEDFMGGNGKHER